MDDNRCNVSRGGSMFPSRCRLQNGHDGEHSFGHTSNSPSEPSEIIDWESSGKSIHIRPRPLAPNTMRRIMEVLHPETNVTRSTLPAEDIYQAVVRELSENATVRTTANWRQARGWEYDYGIVETLSLMVRELVAENHRLYELASGKIKPADIVVPFESLPDEVKERIATDRT